jgi:hypothetical protein
MGSCNPRDQKIIVWGPKITGNVLIREVWEDEILVHDLPAQCGSVLRAQGMRAQTDQVGWRLRWSCDAKGNVNTGKQTSYLLPAVDLAPSRRGTAISQYKSCGTLGLHCQA